MDFGFVVGPKPLPLPLHLEKLRLYDRLCGAETVGTLPSLAAAFVPLAVSRWRERHPRVLLRVVEKVQVELLFGLLRGDFDFVIAQTEFYNILDGFKQRVVYRDRLRVFARPKHRLFRVAKPTWADLAEFPWVFPWWAEGSEQCWKNY